MNEAFRIFLTIVSLFVLGSVVGYIIELFWRRFVSQHHWVNPGFLVGPYLPIYGFGTLALYGINAGIELIPFPEDMAWLKIISSIVLIALALTLIEFIAGLIFIKGFKIKLWDYSKIKGNIMGIICPLYSLFWLAAGAIYYFLLNKPLVDFVTFLSNNTAYYFFVGIIIGMIIVDFCYSMHVASALHKFAKENKVIVSMLQFQEHAQSENAKRSEKIKDKLSKPFFFMYSNLKQVMESYKVKKTKEKDKEKDNG